MPPHLALISCGSDLEVVRGLSRLADFLGVETKVFRVDSHADNHDLLGKIREESSHIACSHLFLSSASHSLYDQLVKFDFVLVFGLDRTTKADHSGKDFVRWLFGDWVELVAMQGEASFTITPNAEFGAQLAGTSFTTNSDGYVAFDIARPLDAVEIIKVAGKPAFIRATKEHCEVFLVGTSDVTDLDAVARRDQGETIFCASLIPWLLFIRYSFRDYCWHNPDPRGTVVIDDPLLRPRYGFLCYEELHKQTEDHNFAATIAHIPWNYNRVSPHTAELLRGCADRISLCVHGCDHTAGEYGSTNILELQEKTRRALAWSNKMQLRTGLRIDPAMVFPQGVFSRTAIPVLKREGFVAALNSGVFPIDAADGEIRIRDLLDVALMRYSAFPIFGRRYPVDLFPFALDFFLGKPCFITQHHDDFKYGYEHLTGFIGGLRRHEPQLRWSSSLESVIARSALYKREGPERVGVKFYSDRFILENSGPEEVTYHLRKHLESGGSVPQVSCGAQPIDARRRADALEFELTLSPGRSTVITTNSGLSAGPPASDSRQKLLVATKVAARRFLSEFRDNTLARSDLLLRISRYAKRVLPI